MTGLHGTPSAADLLAACIAELQQQIEHGGRSYPLRVVAATLAIVERELRAGSGPDDAHAARLVALGFGTEEDLALAIRLGVVPDDRLAAVREAATADVLARLEVVNPGYVEGYE